MKTEAEMGVMWPRAKECQELPEAGRGLRKPVDIPEPLAS